MDEESVAQWLRRIRDTPRALTEAATRDLTDVAAFLLDVLPARAEQLYRAAIGLTDGLPASPSLLVTLRAYAEKGLTGCGLPDGGWQHAATPHPRRVNR